MRIIVGRLVDKAELTGSLTTGDCSSDKKVSRCTSLVYVRQNHKSRGFLLSCAESNKKLQGDHAEHRNHQDTRYCYTSQGEPWLWSFDGLRRSEWLFHWCRDRWHDRNINGCNHWHINRWQDRRRDGYWQYRAYCISVVTHSKGTLANVTVPMSIQCLTGSVDFELKDINYRSVWAIICHDVIETSGRDDALPDSFGSHCETGVKMSYH